MFRSYIDLTRTFQTRDIPELTTERTTMGQRYKGAPPSGDSSREYNKHPSDVTSKYSN